MSQRMMHPPDRNGFREEPLEEVAPIARRCEERPFIQVISLRPALAKSRGFSGPHADQFDKLCLISDDSCLVRREKEFEPASANCLLHFRPGEAHGFSNSGSHRPRLWVLQFAMEPELQLLVPFLRDGTARKLFWQLSMPQAESFKWLFMRISSEHGQADPCCALAESAWLRLLLVNVHRWISGSFAPGVAPANVRPETLRLWQSIQECKGHPEAFKTAIHQLTNYNCLRQEFTSVFGCSPSQAALRARMHVAKNLLRETPLSMKVIAQELGYMRQHEFTRAFHRTTGVSPTRWREQPE